MAEIKLSFLVICQDEINLIDQCFHLMQKIGESINGEFEIIAVDGGSSDGTLERIISYNDPRIKLFRNPWPGYATQRTYARNKASGEWLWRFDVDDSISDNIYDILNSLLSVGEEIKAYSFPKIHLVGDQKYMYNKNLDPSIFLFRNDPLLGWYEKGGLEGLSYGTIPILQHPSHFNFPWQVYEPRILMVHFAELKSFEDRVKKTLGYAQLKGSSWYKRPEEWIRERLKSQLFDTSNPVSLKMLEADICLVSKRFPDLTFYSEF